MYRMPAVSLKRQITANGSQSFSWILYVALNINFRCLAGKFYFLNSTHNDSATKLQLQKLDRDGRADYGSIGPPEQGRIVRNLSSLSQFVGTCLISRVLERVR